MIIYEGYTVENIGFEALEAPPKHKKYEIHEIKLSVLPGQGCARSQVV